MSKLNLVERRQNNRELINIIKSWVEAYPDLRFNQILSNLGVTMKGEDKYYEESSETLKRVKGVNGKESS